MPTISSRSELAWKQYDKTGPGSGGQFPVKCRHCAHTFSTGTTRAIAHLLGGGNGVRKCTKVPKEVLEQLQAATAAVQAEKAATKRNREIEQQLVSELNNVVELQWTTAIAAAAD